MGDGAQIAEGTVVGSTAAQVRAAILDLVIGGGIAPGAPLTEHALARRFSTSRTPVREALQALDRDGLLERGARRGFVLRRLTPDQLDDAFEGLAEIEALAAGLAARRMTAPERMRLEALVAEGAAHAARGDGRAYSRVNAAFHDALLAGAHNATIARAAEGARLQLVAYRSEQFVRSDRVPSSQAEHDAILAAVLDGDATRTADLVRRHIAVTALTVRGMVEDGPATRPPHSGGGQPT